MAPRKSQRYSLRRSTRRASACPFMDTAPLEVRIMIYKLCLPVGKALMLKSTRCEKATGRLRKTPFPNLLQVNSQIREEAAQIFYGTNSWSIIDNPKGLELPDVFFKHVREASVTFDRRIIRIKDFWNVSDEAFDGSLGHRDRLSTIHDELKEKLLETWQDKCSTLSSMSSLTDLTVDFENCKCPLGCCRMVREIFSELDGCVTLANDRRIEMTGLVFEQEAELLHMGNFRCEACEDEPEDEESEDEGSEDDGSDEDEPEEKDTSIVCWRSLLPFEED